MTLNKTSGLFEIVVAKLHTLRRHNFHQTFLRVVNMYIHSYVGMFVDRSRAGPAKTLAYLINMYANWAMCATYCMYV